VALEKLAAGGASFGIALLVSAGIVAEIVAKACSSPQTTHLNAGSRASTLMQWVNIGMVEAALFVAAAAYFDKAHRVPIIIGGVGEGIITYGEYWYAKQAGLASNQPGTETKPSRALW
jgi:preprotein translocase subunit SecY